MDYKRAILVFGYMSAVLCYACTAAAKRTIKDIGFHSKYFPRHYVMPSRKARKLFNLEKKMIPKWLYMEFFMVFPIIALFVVSSLACLVSSEKEIVVGVFFEIYFICGGIYSLYTVIFVFVFRKRKRRKR